MHVFALEGSKQFGQRMSNEMGIQISNHEERSFDDGEAFVAPAVNVRGKDVFVIQSLYGDEKQSINEKLMRLVIMCGAAHDASAARVTAVCPYLGYGRQDRKTSSRAPITTKYIAQILESVHVDRLLTVDAHNRAAIQNAFDCPVDLLEAAPLFISDIAKKFSGRKLTILSPDPGGLERVTHLSYRLNAFNVNASVGCMYKTHVGNEIAGHGLMGIIEGRDVIVVDDMIAGGRTVREAEELVRDEGGRVISVYATHGLFVGNARNNLNSHSIPRIVVTDTADRYKNIEELSKRVEVISTCRLIGEAIKRIHENKSVSDLIGQVP